MKLGFVRLGRMEISYDGHTKSADFSYAGSQIVIEMKHVKNTGTMAAVAKTRPWHDGA